MSFNSAVEIRAFYAQWGTPETYKTPAASKVRSGHPPAIHSAFLNDHFLKGIWQIQT